MEKTQISPFELDLALKVAKASFPPYSTHKRFIRDISASTRFSDRGRWYLAFIAHRYRRQYGMTEAEIAWVNEMLSTDIPGLGK